MLVKSSLEKIIVQPGKLDMRDAYGYWSKKIRHISDDFGSLLSFLPKIITFPESISYTREKLPEEFLYIQDEKLFSKKYSQCIFKSPKEALIVLNDVMVKNKEHSVFYVYFYDKLINEKRISCVMGVSIIGEKIREEFFKKGYLGQSLGGYRFHYPSYVLSPAV